MMKNIQLNQAAVYRDIAAYWRAQVAERDEKIAELLGALERTEQTIRNLANGFLSGDTKIIAENEAKNIRDAIAATEE